MKDINRYTSNEFHDWQRKTIPGKFVIQDLDTWPLIVSDSEKNHEPLCLIELKRSFYPPESWTPFRNDFSNYLSLFKLSQKANIPMRIIYHQKDKSLFENDAKLAVFRISSIQDETDWIDYNKEILLATEFANGFPNTVL